MSDTVTVSEGNGKSKGRRRRSEGRVDAKQEKVIALDPIRERIGELQRLFIIQNEAATEFSDAVKKAAKDSGLLSSVVRKYVVAKARESLDAGKREATQLSLLFDME